MYYLVEVMSGCEPEPVYKDEESGTWVFSGMGAYEKAPIEPFKVLRTLVPSENERDINDENDWINDENERDINDENDWINDIDNLKRLNHLLESSQRALLHEVKRLKKLAKSRLEKIRKLKS